MASTPTPTPAVAEAPAEPTAVRGAIIIPTAEGPKVFTLTMENPDKISPDDIFAGEPTFVARMRGQMPGPDLLGELIKYQTSIWRNSSDSISVYCFTNYLFLNECVYPVVNDGTVKFKLLTNRGYVENLTSSGSRGNLLKFGDKIPSSGVLPNVECVIKASDFGWDGFLSVVRFKNPDGRRLNFDTADINVSISSVGVKLDKIPKLYKIPVHNMHDHGAWCFSSSSAVALKRNPFSQSPSALFHDLVHAPSNADLERENMHHVNAEFLGSDTEATLPLFKLVPSNEYNHTLINMSLPPIWSDITQFSK